MKVDDVRRRITELRLRKGVSEYQMSYDLGHSKSYVNNISSGKSLPSLPEVFAICDYFGVGVCEFFDMENHEPDGIRQMEEELKRLDADDIALVLQFIRRLGREQV